MARRILLELKSEEVRFEELEKGKMLRTALALNVPKPMEYGEE
jgi:hypothetical protein